MKILSAAVQIITTNSYAVVPFHIGEQHFQADGKSLADLAGRLAKSAVEKMIELDVEAKHAAHIRIGAYANAFPPQPKDVTANGATIVGGCCGIGQEHIAVLVEKLK